jgi:hypothetical protein
MRMRFALVAVLLAGCSDDLPSASFIDKLRVLAIQMDPPEVMPGISTTATALVVEPIIKGPDVRTPQGFWLACRPPPGALQDTPCAVNLTSIPPLCRDDASAVACIIGDGLSSPYTPDSSSLGADKTGVVLLTFVVADNGPAEDCLADIQRNNGTPTNPDRCVVAFKRLSVNGNPGATLNQNPALLSLTLSQGNNLPQPLDGTAHFPVDGSTMTLHLTRSDNSAEIEANGDYETLSVSWFTTSGKIDGGRSEFPVPGCVTPSDCPTKAPSTESTTNWIVPNADQLAKTADDTQQVHFWAVARDDRGGTAWLDGFAAAK